MRNIRTVFFSRLLQVEKTEQSSYNKNEQVHEMQTKQNCMYVRARWVEIEKIPAWPTKVHFGAFLRGDKSKFIMVCFYCCGAVWKVEQTFI